MSRLGIHASAKPSLVVGRGLPEQRCGYVADVGGELRLIASDLYVLANLPVAKDTPPGPLTREALEAVEAHPYAEIGDNAVTVRHGAGHEETYARPSGAPYYEQLAKMLGHLPRAALAEGEEDYSVCFDPRRLWRLAQAICHDGEAVRLRIPRGLSRPIVVEPLSGSTGAHGLMMRQRDPRATVRDADAGSIRLNADECAAIKPLLDAAAADIANPAVRDALAATPVGQVMAKIAEGARGARS